MTETQLRAMPPNGWPATDPQFRRCFDRGYHIDAAADTPETAFTCTDCGTSYATNDQHPLMRIFRLVRRLRADGKMDSFSYDGFLDAWARVYEMIDMSGGKK